MAAKRHLFWWVNGLLLLLFVWTLTEEAEVEVRVEDGVCTAVLAERSSDIACGELGHVGLYADESIVSEELAPLDWLAPRSAWREVLWQGGTGHGWERLIFPRQPLEPLGGIPFQKSLLAQTQALLRQILRTHQIALLLLTLGWGVNWLVQKWPGNLGQKWTEWGSGARQRLDRMLNGRWLLPMVIGLVLFVTTFIASEILERIPHVQDSVTYLFQAETLARGHLWAPAPAAPAFFEQEFLLVRDGRWFGKYPPGYPLLLALWVGVVAVYVAFWATGLMYGPRYYYTALPTLLLLTARGIQAVQKGWSSRVGLWLGPGLVALLIALNVAHLPGLLSVYRGYNFVTAPDLTQLAEVASKPALVFVPDEGGWWEYGRYFSYNTPWLDGRFVFARDLGNVANRRLLAHFPHYQAFYWRDGEVVQITPDRLSDTTLSTNNRFIPEEIED